MSRRRTFERWHIPSTVVCIVKTMCADYYRRDVALKDMPPEVAECYRMMNGAIDRALEKVEPGIRRTMMEDIATGRGYDFSPASAIVSRRPYYARKRQIIHDIAVEYRLIHD